LPGLAAEDGALGALGFALGLVGRRALVAESPGLGGGASAGSELDVPSADGADGGDFGVTAAEALTSGAGSGATSITAGDVVPARGFSSVAVSPLPNTK
jgi:hypothetical protein